MLGFLKQIRDGKSSLSKEDFSQLEPELCIIEKFIANGSITEDELLKLIENLKQCAKGLAKTQSSHDEDNTDISTRMSNICGWEVASLVGLVCTHHRFITTKSKQFSSSICVDMYINAVNFLLSHQEARSRSYAATLVRGLAKSMAMKNPPTHSIPPPPLSPTCGSGRSSGEEEEEEGGGSEAVQVYERLYGVILHHVLLHLGRRATDTRPVRLTGEGEGEREQQAQLELDDLRWGLALGSCGLSYALV